MAGLSRTLVTRGLYGVGMRFLPVARHATASRRRRTITAKWPLLALLAGRSRKAYSQPEKGCHASVAGIASMWEHLHNTTLARYSKCLKS